MMFSTTGNTRTEGDESRLPGSSNHLSPLHESDRNYRRSRSGRLTWFMAAGLAVLIIVWIVLAFAFHHVRFAILAPRTEIGVEAVSALARLFGALVLSLFPPDKGGMRLRWVAAGFVILGLGGLAFGYLPPLVNNTYDINTSMYAWLVVQATACGLFVIGLVPKSPPRFTRWSGLTSLAVFFLLSAGSVVFADELPRLSHVTSPEVSVLRNDAMLSGLTGWHWLLSSIPLGLAIAALVGEARNRRDDTLRGWLVVAVVFLAGSQIHNMFWPSVYSPVLTTATLLRLAFTIVVVIGGIWELRLIALERATLLAVEQENSRRLRELAVLKADFTAMVAHELGSPLSAIRRLSEMLATGCITADRQSRALTAIQTQLDVLSALIADVQASAVIERDDFVVHTRPVPLDALLAEVIAFASSLPGEHPFTVSPSLHVQVRADPERIGQVLRNLLSNSAKYSPPRSPIQLMATRQMGRVRIEVTDHGYGIHPDDLNRIFEKFGRGRDRSGRKVSGVGLGLYLSRRILRAHGTDLAVNSELGIGSTFTFELEIV